MPNHDADIKNKNKGTVGTNVTYDKAQGNKGTQLNPGSLEYENNKQGAVEKKILHKNKKALRAKR